MPTRNAIMDALLAKLASAYAFADSGRNARDPENVDDSKRPAIYLVENEDPIERPVPQTPAKRTMHCWALIYTTTGGDDSKVATAQQNDVLDALETALAPDNVMTGMFTIGKLVHSCRIDGTVLRGVDPKTGKCTMGVPLKIILP
jgi:hypothetical protein